ncbi:transcription antitermination factor NusB [Candidatus Roizmanbacteria bacterium]|nr:transcription antitermination factor NusB [Candidatus Roizmanbacteria bacterium]
MDPRHIQRIKTIQNLFAYSFDQKNNLPFPQDAKTKKIITKLKTIDTMVKQYAPRYPLPNIAKGDLAILRLSIYELIYEKKTPHKVIIDEAIELAKELSGEKSYAFINAVLGKILNHKNK